jgi:L,D-transpeptidase YcbB
MEIDKKNYLHFSLIIILLFILACNNSSSTGGGERSKIVSDPDDMNTTAADFIQSSLQYALKNNGKVDDTVKLRFTEIVNKFYQAEDFKPIWSKKEQWLQIADSLYDCIANAEFQGLFPKDYHFKNLKALKKTFDTDSIKRADAVLWSRADLMLTDAFFTLIKDLKQGRLQPDSVSMNRDSVLEEKFFINNLSALRKEKKLTPLLNNLQPKHKGYWELKKAVKNFVDSMDKRTYTYVTYPFKKNDRDDSLFFIKTLQKRLYENNCIDFTNKMADSIQLTAALQKYQRQKGLKADGKVSSALVRTMNISDAERFKRIAITLDRYKQLPDSMPKKYIWVNLPAYTLWVFDNDTIALESRVICGKPDTRTPVLTSAITDMITYPTWTVPNSIIVKSYLPKLKNNPGYLSRLGLKLVNGRGKTIDGGSVNWSKYSKGIPYRVMQNSGDNNSLGTMKFNFDNAYAVYLHDTNQRYLFKNGSRALSHGCVRVQEFQKLAFYIARNDSMNFPKTDTLRYTTDSIKNWLAAKENRSIPVKNHIPLFIRYFSCEGKDGKVKFYDDIYGEDKLLREKYFNDK